MTDSRSTDSELLPLGVAAVEFRVQSSKLFHAATRGELKLVRLGGQWAVSRNEMTSWCSTQSERARA